MLQELQTHTAGKTWRAAWIPTPGGVGTIATLSFTASTSGWVAFYLSKSNRTIFERPETVAAIGERWAVNPFAG